MTKSTPPSTTSIPSSLMDLTSGEVMSYTIGGLYLASTPLATYLSKKSILTSIIPNLLINLLKIKEEKMILTLGGIYFLFAYPLGAGASVLGQSMGGRYANREPRTAQRELKGLARRLVSTHHNLMETFPAFAFVAVMTQLLSPESKEIKALLTLHVLLKTVVFPVAYIADFDIVRSASHIIAIGALCSAFLKLIY